MLLRLAFYSNKSNMTLAPNSTKYKTEHSMYLLLYRTVSHTIPQHSTITCYCGAHFTEQFDAVPEQTSKLLPPTEATCPSLRCHRHSCRSFLSGRQEGSSWSSRRNKSKGKRWKKGRATFLVPVKSPKAINLNLPSAPSALHLPRFITGGLFF